MIIKRFTLNFGNEEEVKEFEVFKERAKKEGKDATKKLKEMIIIDNQKALEV